MADLIDIGSNNRIFGKILMPGPRNALHCADQRFFGYLIEEGISHFFELPETNPALSVFYIVAQPFIYKLVTDQSFCAIYGRSVIIIDRIFRVIGIQE